VTGFGVIVVSGSHSVAQVQEALLEFIRNAPALIRAMDSQAFQNYVTSLITKKAEPPTSLSEATDVNWSQIDDRKYNFYLKEEMVKILESEVLVNKEVMASFAAELLTGEKRRFMIVQASLSSPQSVCPLPISEGVSDSIIIHDPSQLHAHPKTTFYPNLA